MVDRGDPVDYAIRWAADLSQRSGEVCKIPFICAANEKRAGGDWETASTGYEERLCRRSNLSATLSTPAPGSLSASNYPIPCEGGILSDSVGKPPPPSPQQTKRTSEANGRTSPPPPPAVVFRGPHDRYEKLPLESWTDLPIISMPPTRWPKLNHMGTKYSFDQERELTKNKIRAALKICIYSGYNSVVIGDFGLGNGYRNPPQELAEMWRDVFLFDPDVKGQLGYVAFVFEDDSQSTAKCILDDIAKKSKSGGGGGSGAGSKGKTKGGTAASSGSGSAASGASSCLTDFQIFSQAFDNDEIKRVRNRPDPRYGLDMITSPS